MDAQARHKALVLIALATLCWGGAMTAKAAEAPDSTKIVIKDFMFTPMSLTVKAGATVTWVNMDDEPHTVVSNDGLFRSAGMDTNETFSYRFDEPGIYHLTCSIHPRMVATVVVE